MRGLSANPMSNPNFAKIILKESVHMYLRAASFFPDDEPEKQVPTAP
jgi:hypothetical protein